MDLSILYISDDNLVEMKRIHNTFLQKHDYEERTIYNNMVFETTNSSLPNAREACSELGQGFDIIFARFLEIDWVI